MTRANAATKLDLDWQGQYEAITQCRALLRHHPDVARANLPALVAAAAPAVDMLRSYTAKNALIFIQACCAVTLTHSNRVCLPPAILVYMVLPAVACLARAERSHLAYLVPCIVQTQITELLMRFTAAAARLDSCLVRARRS